MCVFGIWFGAMPLQAHAQTPERQRLPRIGFLGLDSAMQAPNRAAFVQGLETLGYIDGKNVRIEYRWAEGRFERLPALAAELAALPVDVIVTAAPPGVRAAQQATSTIPIVVTVHSPIALGFATTLGRPGQNITGMAFQDSELTAKRVDLFRQLVPGIKHLALLWNRQGGGEEGVRSAEAAARQLNIQTLTIEIVEPGELAPAVAKARAWGAQGVIQLASPLITANRKLLLDALVTHRMPAACELRLYVAEGCLMTYSINLPGVFNRLASFVDRLLKGTKVSDLPFEQPREFEFVVNLKTAKSLGLTPASSLLVQATDLIR